MKFILFFSVAVFSASGFCYDLQAAAEKHFLGETSVYKLDGKPLHTMEVKLAQPVSKVEVNDVDHPGHKILNFVADLHDKRNTESTKEIFIYAGETVLNCHVLFVGGEVASLFRCSDNLNK
jgi:hypothetical protein